MRLSPIFISTILLLMHFEIGLAMNPCNKRTYPCNGGLIVAQNRNTQLHDAVRDNDTELATSLIVNGANVNARGNYGFTPLHTAVIRGNIDMVGLLLALAADTIDTTIKDNSRNSATGYVSEYVNKDKNENPFHEEHTEMEKMFDAFNAIKNPKK